jgi:hypothetical protein
MKLIEDGAMISVNGGNGEVRMLDDRQQTKSAG